MSDADWQKQVDWMRKNGVVSAEWSVGYSEKDPKTYLTKCILGPVVEPPIQETPEQYKERLEAEIKERVKQIDDLDFGAS